MKKNHPYRSYEKTLAWKIVDEAIDTLVDNRDLIEQTARTHIVGYVVKQLVESGAVLSTKNKKEYHKAIDREEKTKELKSSILGLTIGNFRLIEGGTLILYLTRGRPARWNQKAVSSSTRLWIDSAWRVCVKNTIIGGSLDDPAMLLPRLRKLIGMTICSARLVGIPGDIVLVLDSDTTIESFSRAVNMEQWVVRRPDGIHLGLRENFELYLEEIENRRNRKIRRIEKMRGHKFSCDFFRGN